MPRQQDNARAMQKAGAKQKKVATLQQGMRIKYFLEISKFSKTS